MVESKSWNEFIQGGGAAYVKTNGGDYIITADARIFPTCPDIREVWAVAFFSGQEDRFDLWQGPGIPDSWEENPAREEMKEEAECLYYEACRHEDNQCPLIVAEADRNGKISWGPLVPADELEDWKEFENSCQQQVGE